MTGGVLPVYGMYRTTRLQQLTPQRAACAGEGEVGKLLIVQRVAQDEDVRHKEDGQLDRHAAGVERAFFGAAQKHDVGQRGAGGVAVVGEQDDLGTVLPARCSVSIMSRVAPE